MTPHAVVVENDQLRIEVWPQLGGKVSSLIDKADKFDLLFSYPAEIPQSCQYDLPYANTWFAGWDECFPAIAPSKYPGHPYDGIAVPDHGELWGLPTTAVPTRDGITTVWHGLRFGYRLTRKLFLDGASVVAEYSLVNLAPFEFRFVWAMHALLSMATPVELQLANPALFRLSHDADGADAQQSFEWPILPEGHDASRPGDLPPRRGWKLFCVDAIESGMVVRYPQRGRTAQIEFSSDDGLDAYWGIWINTGGWNGQRHFAIEPTTGRYDQIDRCVRDRSAGRVAALGRCQWRTRFAVA